jgi:putative nucleotidyltransferase with HDIG domain
MNVDRDRALKAFLAYVEPYDSTNPRIALKVAHTLRVAALTDEIARTTAPDGPAFSGDDVDLCWLIGLLHDIGRFEQVRRFDTFNDAVSVPHAALGTEILFEGVEDDAPLIRTFVEDDSEDETIRIAIAHHSDLAIPDDLGERHQAACHVLRDADKIDILKVNCICPMADIYGVSEEEMAISSLTDAVVATFYDHRTVPRNIRRTPADILVSHVCFAWELVYPVSRTIAHAQGHIDEMLAHRFEDPETDATFRAMAAHMRHRLGLEA